MSIFTATITVPPSAAVIKMLYRHTNIPLGEVRRRLASAEPIQTWDSEAYALEETLVNHLARIQKELMALVALSLPMTLHYSPDIDDAYEVVTLQEIGELLVRELEIAQQIEDEDVLHRPSY